jgi:chemotaxis protein CheZ
MAEPRKIFRIEEMAATRRSESVETLPAPASHTALMAELAALRALLMAARSSAPVQADVLQEPETGRLASELNLIAGAISGQHEGAPPDNSPASLMPTTRISNELYAVVKGTEQATQKVLAAAEEIDQAANNLSAALKGKHEQGLAQDIQDLVIQIFEACNFQDLAGQRIGKVMAALTFIEDHIGRVLDEFRNAASTPRRDGTQVLHGPRLADDHGHASQGDVDAMFV